MVYCMSALFISIPKIYCVVARVSTTEALETLLWSLKLHVIEPFSGRKH